MDEDISAINTSTRNERIKNFFINNKKIIIILLSILVLLIISYFAFDAIKKKNELKIANQYNNNKINFFSGKKSNVEKEMIEIVQAKDKTYSPLALYFLVDNKIQNFETSVLGDSSVITGALAAMDCRVTNEYVEGDHSLFIANVQNFEITDGDPLIWFDGQFGRFYSGGDVKTGF